MTIKCDCEEGRPNKRCEIHNNNPQAAQQQKADVVGPLGGFGPPAIETEDRLTFKTLESNWLDLQLQVSSARAQLEGFGNAMFAKYGLASSDYDIDRARVVFVKK